MDGDFKMIPMARSFVLARRMPKRQSRIKSLQFARVDKTF